MKPYFELTGILKNVEQKAAGGYVIGELTVEFDQGKKGTGQIKLKAWGDAIPSTELIGQTIDFKGSIGSNQGRGQYEGRWFTDLTTNAWEVVGHRAAPSPVPQGPPPGMTVPDDTTQESMPF